MSKPCIVEDCRFKAVRGGIPGYCRTHGGGKRCVDHGCPSAAVSPGDRCKAHGGGLRCLIKHCTKSAAWPHYVCKKHFGKPINVLLKGKTLENSCAYSNFHSLDMKEVHKQLVTESEEVEIFANITAQDAAQAGDYLVRVKREEISCLEQVSKLARISATPNLVSTSEDAWPSALPLDCWPPDTSTGSLTHRHNVLPNSCTSSFGDSAIYTATSLPETSATAVPGVVDEPEGLGEMDNVILYDDDLLHSFLNDSFMQLEQSP